jgi:peptidoglycan/xylan/chitin deacetylase (PgdA/CDA1 family)
MSMLRQVMRSALAMSVPRRWLLVSGPAHAGVCLTFDDGPHPEHTPRVLDALGQHGVTATFFVVGQEAEKYPELVRRIAAEGHAVAQHSYSHGEPSKTPTHELLEEIAQTTRLLADILGTGAGTPAAPHATWFRPPKGELSAGKLLALRRLGMSVMLWNVDPRDYKAASPAALAQWFDANPLRGGDVVLLHDAKPHAHAVIGHIARQVRERGLEFTRPLEWNGKHDAAKVATV